MKTKKQIDNNKKKNQTTISIITLLNKKVLSKPKNNTIKPSIKEKSVPNTSRTNTSINTTRISTKPRVAKQGIKKAPTNKTKHTIIFSGLNSTKISFEKNSHTIMNSITSFNSRLNNNNEQSKNTTKQKTHVINKTVTTLPTARNYSIGKKVTKQKIGKCSINSIYVKLDDILGNAVRTEPNENQKKKIKQKKENKKHFIFNNPKRSKNETNYSNIDKYSKCAITDVNISQGMKKKKSNNTNLKLNLLSLIRENKNSFLQEKKKNKNNKTFLGIKSNINKTEYTIDNVLDNEKSGIKGLFPEFDNFDDLYSIVRKLNYEKIDPKKVNLFSQKNENYETFSVEYSKKFNSMFTHGKFSESKLTNTSHSTQENSNKKRQSNQIKAY